jgi:hypothetical protein
MAAWEQLKEMAGEMRDAFIDAVKDFIKTKIIEQAIQWIVSLFVPGAGIIKAIIGIYDTIVFFINKAKQIMQMISNFLGSISEIASGNIGAAADAMENGLARGLSLVINFLAQLLHLNGITDKIRSAIQKIRDKVDVVLLKVAKWIAEKAKAIWGAVKQGASTVAGKIMGWWGAKNNFTAKDGSKHSIFFEGEGKNAKLIVKSDPKPFDQTVNERRAQLDASKDEDKPKLKALADAVKEKGVLDGLITHFQSIDVNKISATQSEKLNVDIQASLNKIGSFLAISGVDSTPTDVVKTHVKHTQSDGRAWKVTAEPLTYLPGNTSGSKPSEEILGWDKLKTQYGVNRQSYWVAAHLLNGNIHGPGVDWNLTPGTKQTNNNMRTEVENWAKDAVLHPNNKNRLYYYETTVDYYDVDPPDMTMKYYPKKIDVHWGEAERDGAGFKRLTDKGKAFQQDKPPVNRLAIVSFNQGTSNDLIKAADGQLTDDECVKIINLRRGLPGQKFNSILHLYKKFGEAYPSNRALHMVFTNLYLDNKIGLHS